MLSIPKGFRYAGVGCGIKASQAKDLALILSETPATAAGVYTQNQVVAAPVLLCKERTPQTTCRAVIVNSGNANACTGGQGMTDALRMCELVGENCSGVAAEQTLVMSTGVIGHKLPMQKIVDGVPALAASLGDTEESFCAAADAILTTDISRKIEARTFSIQGKDVCLAGMAKGAGMIGPNMATMLGCLTTDLALNSEQAQEILRSAVAKSFNSISVEGHTSTNDTVLLLANGRASNDALSNEDIQLFSRHLTEQCIELAKMIPTDGEGASHLIEIRVDGADSDEDAEEIAMVVASSNLVKTAVYGNDPNWGRIVSAAGYAKAKVDVDNMSLKVNDIRLFAKGEPLVFDEAAASASMRDSHMVVIELSVGAGAGAGVHWSSDLGVKYVQFNSEYTT